MIAVVKWCAVVCALFFLLPPPAAAADDLPGAARELASKTAAWAGRGEPVTVTWRNLSSLGSAEFAQVRGVFENAQRIAEGSAAEVRVTLSENQTQYLLAVEARRGEEQQVWIASWKRSAARPAGSVSLTLEKKLLWQQDEPILDVAFAGDAMAVLSPGRLTWVRGGAPSSIALGRPRVTWPRDVRGRLRATSAGFEAYLPGLLCRFTETSAAGDCRVSGEPWPLESGSRATLMANFEITRNFFDGRVGLQSGARKTAPPFYSAAAFEDRGATLWLLALLDGRTQIFDAAFDAVEAIPGWGSDIAGISAPCGGWQQILATGPGDGSELDSIQAFTLVNRAAVRAGGAMEMPGPVTALWPSGGAGAIAVVRDLQSGKYAAYLISLACGD